MSNLLPPAVKNNISVDISIKSQSWNYINFNAYQYCKHVTKIVINNVLRLSNNDQVIEVSLLLADNSILHGLNKEYRSIDKPTNVLSFPHHINGLKDIKESLKNNEYLFLGDIAISFEKIIDESLEYGKPFIEHFSHILIHGLLHLLGYDHIDEKEAIIMEDMETKIIKKIKLKNIKMSLR